MKKHALNAAKWAISLTIIIFLVYKVVAEDQETFTRLREEPKDWPLLLAALVCLATAVTLTFVRWFWLVRALDLPFRFADALRLGYIGYMFNLVSLGSVGGDLFKAVFIAREHPERKTEAVATIILDRFIGLYGILILASVVMLNIDLAQFGERAEQLAAIRWFTWTATGVVSLMFVALLLPFFLRGPIVEKFCNIPRLGPTIRKLVDAALVYRQQRDVLWMCILLTIGIHCLMVLVFYFCSRALPNEAPPLLSQFAIVPIGMLCGAIPLPGGGLGAFEAVMEFLYAQISPVTPAPVGQGLLIALTYRVLTILVGLIGVGYYLRRRKEVDEVYHQAELEEESEASGHVA